SSARSGARRNREWLTAFQGPTAVRAARFVVHHKDGRLAYLGRRPKPSSKEGRLRAGSRTVVPQGTWAGLTSGFGMGPGVSPPLWPSNHCCPRREGAGYISVSISEVRGPRCIVVAALVPRARALVLRLAITYDYCATTNVSTGGHG